MDIVKKDTLNINGEELSAYLVSINGIETIIMGENISDIFDKLEELKIEKYELIYARSLEIWN